MGITTGAQGLTVHRRGLWGSASGNPAPLWFRCTVRRKSRRVPSTTTPLPYQNTRFQTRIAEAGARLSEWSLNPWRKLSLLVLTFLLSFLIGVGLGSISGALDLMDLVAAVLCVLVLELSVRARGVLRRAEGDRLPLHLLDMARMGLLYGLLLEGFKLL
ncbi:MAG: DUF565 domain-containing protein [Cyanobacteria bacterium K_Offshore_surface_m2_239]|nr:DUF565 domain-containing protein [Cyanobacteria bacterium K_Offshore_surface_m2_239]